MPLENGIILNKDGELFRKLELLRRENELGLIGILSAGWAF